MVTRPNRKKAVDRTLAGLSAGALLAAGVLWASDARADTVSMRGVLGYQPDYANLGLCPCKPLSHPVMPWSVATITDRIAEWVETPDAVNPSPKVALTYSLSTVGALEYLEEPGAKPVEVWAFGSPETPRKNSRDRVVPESRQSVRFAVALYDPIADPMKRWNFYAAINSRLSTHLHGYDDLDLSNPSATYTAADGSTTLYFAPEVLPMLKWREKWTTPERMAELDAKYRPRIEAAYDRPVHVPAPSEPEPELAEEETWSASTTSITTTTSRSAKSANSEPSTDDTPLDEADTKKPSPETPATTSDDTESDGTGSTGLSRSESDTDDQEPSEPDTSDAPADDSDNNEGGDE